MKQHDTTELCAKIERMRAVGITARTAEDTEIAIVLAALALFAGTLEAVEDLEKDVYARQSPSAERAAGSAA